MTAHTVQQHQRSSSADKTFRSHAALPIPRLPRVACVTTRQRDPVSTPEYPLVGWSRSADAALGIRRAAPPTQPAAALEPCPRTPCACQTKLQPVRLCRLDYSQMAGVRYPWSDVLGHISLAAQCSVSPGHRMMLQTARCRKLFQRHAARNDRAQLYPKSQNVSGGMAGAPSDVVSQLWVEGGGQQVAASHSNCN